MSGEAQVGGPQYDRTGRYFILGALAVALFLAWKLFRPFFSAIAIAAILDIIFYPFFDRLRRSFGGRGGPAAALTVVVVVLVVIVPVVIVGFLVTKQAVDLYQSLTARAADASLLDGLLRIRDWDAAEAWLSAHAPWLDVKALNLKGIAISFLGKVSDYGVRMGTSVASNVVTSVGTFAVVLFSLFFFLLDGGRFARWASGLVPLHDDHLQQLQRTFVGIVKSAVVGSGVVALVQGVLGGSAFWLVGLPGTLWGAVMAFMSLVPVVGCAIVWLPAALILFAQGHTGAALFLLLWGFIVISSVDNVVRILVVKGPVEMHPLLIFFSVLGGIQFAGMLGVVFGPLIVAVVQALLEIFRCEFMEPPAPPAGQAG
ncbi:MAG TPA: AI-2E family transporter [bacterium]